MPMMTNHKRHNKKLYITFEQWAEEFIELSFSEEQSSIHGDFTNPKDPISLPYVDEGNEQMTD